MPRSPFTTRGTPFAVSSRPFISCESRVFPSALPPFIYPLTMLALHNPKRFCFSDYMSLSPVLPRFVVRVFRADRTCAFIWYHYHDIYQIQSLYNRCTCRVVSHGMRMVWLCVFFSYSHRTDTSFSYFLKIMPLLIASLYSHLRHNPHLSSLT